MLCLCLCLCVVCVAGGTWRPVRAPKPELSFEQAMALEGRPDSRAVDARPRTSAVSRDVAVAASASASASASRSRSHAILPTSESSSVAAPPPPAASGVYCCVGATVALHTVPTARSIRMDLVSTWGDLYYMGLTGIEVLVLDDADAPVARGPACGTVRVFPLNRSHLWADPSDINRVRVACGAWRASLSLSHAHTHTLSPISPLSILISPCLLFPCLVSPSRCLFASLCFPTHAVSLSYAVS
jgi:hypothetical protein